jgi:hypothetical protein
VLRLSGTNLISDDINGWGYRLQPVEGGLAPFGDTSRLFRKGADPAPAAISPDWRQPLGDYGPSYNPVRIIDRDGQLVVLIEMAYAPLTRESGDTLLSATSSVSGWPVGHTSGVLLFQHIVFVQNILQLVLWHCRYNPVIWAGHRPSSD